MSEPADDGVWYAGLEAGGTTIRCIVARGPREVRSRLEIPTGDPTTTLAEALAFFRAQAGSGISLRALGIGTFGPVELDPAASDFGRITTTPKPGWAGVDVLGTFATALSIPVRLETDVNAAALGEARWGAGRGLPHLLYVTVGTGIGVGAIVGGRLVRGRHHPEMGHMLVPMSPDEPAGFQGICPYHGACVEGLASGSAIVSRWHRRLVELEDRHPAWQLEAGYLSAFLANLTFAFQPDRIIVGGGVVNERLRSRVVDGLGPRLAGYRVSLTSPEALASYVTRPGLGDDAGLLGAIALACSGSSVTR